MVALTELLEAEEDFGGYITYVFLVLDEEIRKCTKYIMCTRFPNWNTKILKKGDIGYLHFEERQAGIDKWFDGQNFIPYQYNSVQFMKFVSKTNESNEEYIIQINFKFIKIWKNQFKL